jgi:hypothetical protein
MVPLWASVKKDNEALCSVNAERFLNNEEVSILH